MKPLLAFLRSNAHANPEQETLDSKEWADLLALWDRHFPWQEGRYTARIDINIVGVKRLTTRLLYFRLSANEIQRLRGNLAEIKRYEQELIRIPAEPSMYTWNWVYPSFNESAAS